MTFDDPSPTASAVRDIPLQKTKIAIPQLVSEVYESAPVIERGRLLQTLLRSFGALSLLGVANGTFANILFRNGGIDRPLAPQAIEHVTGNDVGALVDYVQRINTDTIDELLQTLAVSPVLAGCAATGLLVTLLIRRSRRRPENAPSTCPESGASTGDLETDHS